MIGTRQLARLLDHTEQQAVKVVLVGDPRQLPEIDAGGLFRALSTRLPSIELNDNRRQQHGWEQAALDELRHGNPDAALAAYSQHGRIRTADTAQAVRGQLVEDWWTTARDDLPGSIMVALRRDDVAELNHRARNRMLTAGRLTGPRIVTTGGEQLQTGDRIVCLRNDQRVGVVNGTRATITHIDLATRTIEAVDDRGVQLALPSGYIDAGHVAHGYAITGHKAQGLTGNHTYTLGTETLYREWGYVAMSRGRITNQLYHGPGSEPDEALHHHAHHDEDIPGLASRLRRSRAEEPISPEVAQLASRWRSMRWLASNAIHQQPHFLADHDRAVQERAAAARRLDDLERRQPRAAGPAIRRSVRERRTALAAELERVRDRLQHLDHTLAQLDDRLARLPSSEQIQAARHRLGDLDAQLDHHSQLRTVHLANDPPAYLVTALGTQPATRPGRERWRQTVTAIEDHRIR